MIDKTITLNHTGFVIRGEVVAELYNGEEFILKMKPSIIKDPDFDINESSVTSFINTKNIAVKMIKSAIVHIDLDYQGYRVFYEEFLFNY